MGVRLIVEMLDHAPEGATAAERLVLVVLAENANDATRQAWPGMDVIVRRTGLTADSVTKVLRRLAGRGVEVRVPISTTRTGRAVYAAHGHRTTYHLPTLASPDHRAGLKPGPQGGLDDEARTTVRGSPDHSPLKPGPQGGPSPQEPSENPQQLAARDEKLIKAIALVRSSTDAVDDGEAAAVLELIRTEKEPENLYGFVRHLAAAGELPDWLDRVHDDRDERAMAEAYAAATQAPPCEHDTPGGTAIHPTTGMSWLCALCRIDAVRATLTQAGKPWEF